MWKCFVVFNLHFSLFDEERCEDFAEQAINPFSTESLIICALDWLKAHPHRVQQAIEAEFDCLIVDEAHHWLGPKMHQVALIY